jgi:hypothetical protein
MTDTTQLSTAAITESSLISSQAAPLALPAAIPEPAGVQLARMFRDPSLLERPERAELVQHLRQAVALQPESAPLRVLLGMALCVNFDGQSAMGELREACRLEPESFIARLKFGELLMRLRICDQAAEQTHMAAELATNSLQAELARRQAATIRTMQREGIERGGYGKMLQMFSFTRRWRNRSANNAVSLSPQ